MVSYRVMGMENDPWVPSPRNLGIALQFLQPMSQRHIRSPGLSEAEGLVEKQAGHRRRAERRDVGFRGALLPPINDTAVSLTIIEKCLLSYIINRHKRYMVVNRVSLVLAILDGYSLQELLIQVFCL